jgi:hypothetical protein
MPEELLHPRVEDWVCPAEASNVEPQNPCPHFPHGTLRCLVWAVEQVARERHAHAVAAWVDRYGEPRISIAERKRQLRTGGGVPAWRYREAFLLATREIDDARGGSPDGLDVQPWTAEEIARWYEAAPWRRVQRNALRL